MLLIESGAVPLLVRVRPFAELVVETICEPNERLVTLKDATGVGVGVADGV
jgi:hypothetical protein